MDQINIFWHRRDLRYFDNSGLYYALTSSLPVLPVFVFDKNILDDLEDKSDARVTFIYDQISNLHLEYKNQGSGLYVFCGTPKEAYEALIAKYDVQEVYTNRDYEPYAKDRDQSIETFLKDNESSFLTFKDQVIFERGEIMNDQGEPYKVFTPYKNKWLEKFKNQKLESFPSEDHLEKLFKHPAEELPTLADFGFERSEIEIPDRNVSDELIQKYDKQRDIPAVNGTSRLGVHLRFGTISIRNQVLRARKLNGTWLNELIWREFYMMILAHFPNVVDKAFKSRYDQVPWINNEEQFSKWCEGKTGYPIVDAGMRELNNTGYMHNRVRMIVASFLTKHLLIDWRWGEQYFAKKLLDFELSSNNGGWQWAAGTGTDAQPYFRVFNPYSQQEKFDKDFAYIKKWVPEFGTSNYPDPIVSHKEARQRAIDTFKEAIS
ncbi:MAG: deoxyribodipyrimidine photo-lyase [Marinoscillum sp.]